MQRIPWSEVSVAALLALAALTAGVGAWDGARSLVLVGAGIVLALWPRFAHRREPVATSARLAAAMLGGVLVTHAAVDAPRALAIHRLAPGLLALATFAGLVSVVAHLAWPWRLAVLGGIVPVVAVLVPRAESNGVTAASVVGAALFATAAATSVRSRSPRRRAALAPVWQSAGVSVALGVAASFARPWSDVSDALVRIGTAYAAVAGLVFSSVRFDAVDDGTRARRFIAALTGALVGTAAGLETGEPGLAGVLGALVTVAAGWRLDRVVALTEPGRVFAAAARARELVRGAHDARAVAGAALTPVRDALGDLEARAQLWLVDEVRAYAVDVTGEAREAPWPTALVHTLVPYVRARPGSVHFTEVLAARVVRRPEVRPVVDVLTLLDAFAVVPVCDGAGLLAILVFPRGRRTAFPTAREDAAFRSLAADTAAVLESVLALERARRRADDAERTAHLAAESASAAEARRLAAESLLPGRDARITVASDEDRWVGYSAAMRTLDAELLAAAARSGPVVLVAPVGVAIAPVVQRLRSHEPNRAGPLVEVDASHPGSVPPWEQSSVGDTGPHWLSRARDGTVLVRSAERLDADTLAHLASPDVRARVVLVVGDPKVVESWPAAVRTRLALRPIALPTLAVRAEDVEGLVLLAIDRACRRLGRPSVGIEREALAALRTRAFVDDQAGLDAVVERAVSVTSGARIALSAIVPTDATPPLTADDATYDARERRLLVDALERAGGNRSEAARVLGIARTTLLDKMKRLGVR